MSHCTVAGVCVALVGVGLPRERLDSVQSVVECCVGSVSSATPKPSGSVVEDQNLRYVSFRGTSSYNTLSFQLISFRFGLYSSFICHIIWS